MAYISESSRWRSRRRHRQQATLVVAVLLLLAAGGAGYAFFTGMIGGKGSVDVSTLPPCPTSTGKPLVPAQVVVNVYNATDRGGLAAQVATSIGRRSFQIGVVANDPLRAKVAGTAVVRYGPRGAAGARLVATQVDAAKLLKDKRKNATVDLVLGAKFKGLRSLAAITATPAATPTCRPVSPSATPTSTKSTPAVSRKPSATTSR